MLGVFKVCGLLNVCCVCGLSSKFLGHFLSAGALCPTDHPKLCSFFGFQTGNYFFPSSLWCTRSRGSQVVVWNHRREIVQMRCQIRWPDIVWSVNKFARSIITWTKACDKRLNRLISYIHHTSEYQQYCHVGDTAQQCRLGLFQNSDFAGDLEESTSGRTLCIFESHTFVPISWMCQKQTSVSHSSTESEIISLDTGLRLDGLPALELWDLIVSVLGIVSRVSDRSGTPESDDHKHHKSLSKIDALQDTDSVPSNIQFAREEVLLYVLRTMKLWLKWLWRKEVL